MSSNSIGKKFNFTTWGESHGKAIGCVVDGVPSKIPLKESDIQSYLNKRKPGQSKYTTQRKEKDLVEILSGVFEGVTTGHPISLIIYNEDHRSKDYSEIKDVFRPGHADYTYWKKYGIRDYRGGGRSSARETAMRVAAGAIAKKYLAQHEVKTTGYVSQIGSIAADSITPESANKNKYFFGDMSKIDDLNNMFEELIAEGNSVGAKLGVCVENCPVGLGEPVFDKLNADLAKAIMSINAVKSVSIGNAENILNLKGSEIRDEIKKLEEAERLITYNENFIVNKHTKSTQKKAQGFSKGGKAGTRTRKSKLFNK